MNIKKYTYSFDRFEGFMSGENTIKETLKMIKNEDEGYHTEVFIGEAYCLRPKISASNVLEKLQEDAYDQADENADSYLSNVSEIEYRELEDELNKVLFKWEKKNGQQPTFYTVKNIKVYNVSKKMSEPEGEE